MEGEHHATECESEKPSSAVCGAFAAVVYDEKVKERLTQWIKLQDISSTLSTHVLNMTAFIQGHVPTHTKEINVPFFQVFTAGWQQENRTKKDTLSFCTTAHPFSVNRRVVEHCINLSRRTKS